MKNKIADLLLLVGMTSISAGFFILNIITGFIIAGLGLIILAFLLQERGDD